MHPLKVSGQRGPCCMVFVLKWPGPLWTGPLCPRGRGGKLNVLHPPNLLYLTICLRCLFMFFVYTYSQFITMTSLIYSIQHVIFKVSLMAIFAHRPLCSSLLYLKTKSLVWQKLCFLHLRYKLHYWCLFNSNNMVGSKTCHCMILFKKISN